MRKKFLGTLLMGTLILGSTGFVTSCKDYDDQINNLQQQIDANKKLIEQIQTLITNGSVIKDVQSVDGGIKIVLSNGKDYTITNGKDGKDGAAWTIKDGYWCLNGEKTENKAIGVDGKNGVNGKDGKYYVPNEGTGMFDVYENGTVKNTKISFLAPGTITATMDQNELTLYNVKGIEGGKITIAVSNVLRGFVFQKDQKGRYIEDGVPTIRIESFRFKEQTLDKQDSKNEKAELGSTDNNVNVKTYAYYKVTPSNANVEDLKKLAFEVQKDAEYGKTRAAASADFNATPKFVEFKDGVLKVEVNVTGRAAEKEHISEASLEATTRNNQKVNAEYVAFTHVNDPAIRIFNQKATPMYQLRSALAGINEKDAEAGKYKTMPVWSTTDTKDIDVELTLGDKVDLNTVVKACFVKTGSDPEAVDLESHGMQFKFDVVKNYKLGTNATPQDEFITLANNGEISARVFGDKKNFAAVGRTPIVRAYLMHGDKAVEIAYIKVHIVKKTTEPTNVDLKVADFTFACGQDCTVKTSVEQSNVNIYNVVGMDRDDFHNTYKVFDAQDGKDDQVGKVEEVTENVGDVTTHVLKWTLTNDEMWKNADKEELTRTVYYRTAAGEQNKVVKITLKTGKIKDIQKVYDLGTDKYLSNYWNADKTTVEFNVATPDAGSTDATKCTYVNNLNSPFKTNENGKLLVDTKVEHPIFIFNKEKMESIKKIGDVKVKFEVSADGLTLTDNGAEVAKIKNEDNANTVELVNNSEVGKQLLNTGKMHAYFSVSGYICGNTDRKVSVTFNGAEYFRANFLRPLNVAANAAEDFVDGVNFGDKGSYIALEKLITPTDWRNNTANSFAENTNYWQYYGVKKISVDLKKVTSNLNGESGTLLPTDIKLGLEGGEFDTNGHTFGTPEAKSLFGFLTYKNNGTSVQEPYELTVPVKVTYKWGVIETNVKVKVTKTIKK